VKEHIQDLLEKYSRNACTSEELRRLEAWYHRIGEGQRGTNPNKETIERMWTTLAKQLSHKGDVSTTIHKPAQRLFRQWRFTAVAAAILLCLGVGMFMIKQASHTSLPAVADLAPGQDKAFLTLSDGKKIALNDVSDGKVAEQEGLEIVKRDDGTVICMVKTNPAANLLSQQYNTIETPRGGQYQVVLSDGTKVWLNASSSLTFPVHFAPTMRHVRISGEAYFDVSSQYIASNTTKRAPFIVETGRQKIEVLGTQFNVNTYPENREQRTTLVEGRVKVVQTGNGEIVMLAPGESAQTGQHISVSKADIEKDIAWKNGDFIFKDERLSTILQQVSRWYNVEIDCPNELEDLAFNGMVSRQKPLSSIITMLQSTGSIQVELKERRLIIKR